MAFRDRRPLPAGAFPNVAAIYREEGATHYWLYRVVQNLEAYLGCFIANNTPWAPPKGWNLLTMANVTEGTRVLPFAAVIQNAATRQVSASAGLPADGPSRTCMAVCVVC